MKYMTREYTDTPYILERSVIDDESEMVLTSTASEDDESVEDILDIFAREYMEDV